MDDDRLIFFNKIFRLGYFASTITPLLPAHDLAIIVVLNYCAGAGFLCLWIFNSWIIWRQKSPGKQSGK